MTPRFMNRKVVVEKAKDLNAPVFRPDLKLPLIKPHRGYPVFFLGELLGFLYRNVYGNHAWVFHPHADRLKKGWRPTLMGPGLSADEAKRCTMGLVTALMGDPSERGPGLAPVRLFSCQWCGGDHAVRFSPDNDSTYVGSYQCWHCGTHARAYTRVF